jgi:fructose-specific phosphotransferase system IIA component
MDLATYTRPELIFLAVPGQEGSEILAVLAERLAAAGVVPDAVPIHQLLLEREALCSTGIGSGIAIPHCKLKTLRKPVLAVATSAQAIDFKALDGKPVQVFLLLVSPEDAPAEHLQVLAGISKWIKGDPTVIDQILSASAPEAVLRLLGNGDEEVEGHE